MALMLGHSLKLHNNLDRIDAGMVLLTLDPDDNAVTGLTAEKATIF